MKKPKGSASSSGRTTPSHHHAPELIIDPPHHLAPIFSDSHHAQLQRHAAQKTHALMTNVMAQARGSDIGPRLVLQPKVINAVLVGPTDEEGIGIDLVAAGVVVQVEAWTPMAVGDLLEVFWGSYPGTASVSRQLTTPDELNKPVYLTIPATLVSAGWVSIVARVTRSGSGFLDVSPALPLLVKLDPPGGITPPPDTNLNLIAPVLPPEVLANGVDATWSANGVPVTIQPYPNMDEGDRIRLNWGGAYIERTVVKADVGNPVTLTVDDATIRSVGDSDALIVRYQVIDLVGNRSGWSPSVEIEVDVIEGALLPPEVNHTDDDNVIDLDLLGSDDVSVFVTAFSPDFAIGDEITLTWLGHTSTGAQVPYTAKQTVTRSPVQTLEFLIPNASVVALAQGDAVVSYSLSSGRTSRSTTVTIVGEAVTLPRPSIDGVTGGQLDASLTSATVRITANPIFAPGDVITLIWSGTRADGSTLLYQPTRLVTGSMLDDDILIPVPGSEIAPLAGGTLQVSYTLQHGDGTLLPASGVLMLMVGSGAGLLLPPTVVEAPDNATLDPDNVNVQATVMIQPYDDMDVGDQIDMYWVGSSGDTFHDWTKVSNITNGRPITFPVDKDPHVIDNDGGMVTVSYTVTKGAGVRTSAALTLQVGEVQENPQPGTNPHITVTEADPLTQTLNIILDISSVHVVIDDGDIAIGDEVTMIWQGTPGSGTQQQLVTVRKIGPITFTIAMTVVQPNYNSTVQIGYTVRRSGAPTPPEPTEWYDLLIEKIAMQGDAIVAGSYAIRTIVFPQTSITIPENLPTNEVIMTSLTNSTIGPVTISCPTDMNAYLRNANGPNPKSNSTLYPTGTSGIAFQVLFDAGDGNGASALTAGPQLYPSRTFTDRGTTMSLKIVKTGPISPGIYKVGLLAVWAFGSSRKVAASVTTSKETTVIVV